MTTTPESQQEPTAAQLIAIALGTSPPVPADAVPTADTADVRGEVTPPVLPATPA